MVEEEVCERMVFQRADIGEVVMVMAVAPPRLGSAPRKEHQSPHRTFAPALRLYTFVWFGG